MIFHEAEVGHESHRQNNLGNFLFTRLRPSLSIAFAVCLTLIDLSLTPTLADAQTQGIETATSTSTAQATASTSTSTATSTAASSAAPSAPAAAEPNQSARFLVHILDYLARDYAGAVGENKQILSEFEYKEQVEFIASAVKASQSVVEISSDASIRADLEGLQKLILDKEVAAKITAQARNLQQRIIAVGHIELYPSQWPSLRQGETLYAQNCASCHGQSGAGNGPAGKGLEPAPTNFASHESMQESAPFAYFNTIRLGIPGTGMAAFQKFSDQEVWALAFYVNSIRFNDDAKVVAASVNAETPGSTKPEISTAGPTSEAGVATSTTNQPGGSTAAWDPANKETLRKIATSTDRQLLAQLPGANEHEKRAALVRLRTFAVVEGRINYLDLAKQKLREAETAFAAGDISQAKASALEAYLEGIEPVEARIRASDPGMVAQVEEEMAEVRTAIESKVTPVALGARIQLALAKIDEAAMIIERKEISPVVAFLAAFGILLREGFEAVLIILALLGVIRAADSKRAAVYVHGGWVSALGLGVVAWLFSGWVMGISGASREFLEGATSLIAVSVLLYVGFWLHRQTEISRWKTFLEVQVKGFLEGKKLWGLAAISFLAVFREAIETVLFLRAIWLDLSVDAKAALAAGVASSLVFVVTLAWAALNFSRRLPLKTLFTFSSLMMLVLSTILAGKGFHSFQEAGFVGVTALPWRFRMDLIGLYPTAETVLAQLVTFVLVVVLWVFGSRPGKPQTRAERTNVAATSI